MDIQEIIDLLEEISERCSIIESNAVNYNVMEQIHILTGYRQGVGRNDGSGIVDQALILLEQRPTAGDFTEKFNRIIEEAKSMFVVSQAMAKNSFDSTLQIPVEGETDNPDPLPDHEYPQQPEPTSLSNTIRHIADNIKSETDRNIICQATDRLDAWWKYINELKEEVDLLKQQPTIGAFTKKLRNDIGKYKYGYQEKIKVSAIIEQSEEACDRLDRAEARLKAIIVKVKKGIKRDGPTPSP